MTKVRLFDTKRFAIHDGPGIRMTIFFKGCPLSCSWCHNPESIETRQQKLFHTKRCIGAQHCIQICPNKALKLTPMGIVTDKSRCSVCGKCAQVCPTKALEISGEDYEIAELKSTIEREVHFFDQSDGGITFSGGEPLLQHQALKKLLKFCGENEIHRAVDTSLFATRKVVEDIALKTELFLVDLKSMDDEIHTKYTGVSNKIILENIEMLARKDHDFIIRMPLIEGVNADEKNLVQSAQFLSSLPWRMKQVDFLPYHNTAKHKLEKLDSQDKQPEFKSPSPDKIKRAISIFSNYNIEAKEGG